MSLIYTRNYHITFSFREKDIADYLIYYLKSGDLFKSLEVFNIYKKELDSLAKNRSIELLYSLAHSIPLLDKSKIHEYYIQKLAEPISYYLAHYIYDYNLNPELFTLIHPTTIAENLFLQFKKKGIRLTSIIRQNLITLFRSYQGTDNLILRGRVLTALIEIDRNARPEFTAIRMNLLKEIYKESPGLPLESFKAIVTITDSGNEILRYTKDEIIEKESQLQKSPKSKRKYFEQKIKYQNLLAREAISI